MPPIKKIATIIVGIPEPMREFEKSEAVKDHNPSNIPIRENINPERSANRAGRRDVLTSPFMAVSIKTKGVALDFPNSRFPHR